MDDLWLAPARRMVQGLDVQPGELIAVRDLAGRCDVLIAVLLALDLAGATPLPEITPAAYLQRLLREVPPALLREHYRAHHRQAWVQQADRILVLGGAPLDTETLPPEAFAAWQQARQRITLIEEERRLPYLLVAIPTESHAQQLALSLAELETALLPALSIGTADLQHEIARVLAAAQGSRTLTIRTTRTRSGETFTLHLAHGERPWLSDDGFIDANDRARGAIVSNLPAGSLYTTVLEGETQGRLWLEQVGPAADVVLHFAAGRIVHIEAASGAEHLAAWLDSHAGEPRRVGHIGIGLNPRLRQPVGWTLVDEHVYGYLFIALGENRYMGGQNESELNADIALAHATLLADDRVLVAAGTVVV